MGLLISMAWILEHLERGIFKIAPYVDWLWGFVVRYNPSGKPHFRRDIQVEDLCRAHRLSILRAYDVFRVVAMFMVVVFFIFMYADFIQPVVSLWFWTYRVGLGVLGLLALWMAGTLLHAQRRCLRERH